MPVYLWGESYLLLSFLLLLVFFLELILFFLDVLCQAHLDSFKFIISPCKPLDWYCNRTKSWWNHWNSIPIDRQRASLFSICYSNGFTIAQQEWSLWFIISKFRHGIWHLYSLVGIVYNRYGTFHKVKNIRALSLIQLTRRQIYGKNELYFIFFIYELHVFVCVCKYQTMRIQPLSDLQIPNLN